MSIKTTFAGLTQLEPNENPFTDGAAFFGRDRATIDRYLEIGAVTHRHDEHAALGNPSRAPSATVDSTGGVIPASLTAYVGYTLLDSDGGETTISPVVAVTTPPPIDPPQSAPVASADYSAGDLLANTYYYVITLIDAYGGETPAGPWVQVDRSPGYASGQVLLSGLQAPMLAADAAGWRLYRATGGGQFELMATGSDDTYTDSGASCLDCSQRPPAPSENTTNRHNTLNVVVPSGALMSQAAGFNLYASDDGTFSSPALLGSYAPGSAMTTLSYPALNMLNGSPPDRSTSVRGASKIDPDTDLLDWHWKRPVSTSAGLGSGANGDVRMTLDTKEVWTPSGGSGTPTAVGWRLIVGSGGGGGGGVVDDVDALADWFDDFSTDRQAEYDLASSGGTGWQLSGGKLLANGVSGDLLFGPKVALLPKFVDGAITLKVEPAATSCEVLLFLRYDDYQNNLLAYFHDSALEIYKTENGVQTQIGTPNSAGNFMLATHWARFQVHANKLSLERYTSAPSRSQSPAQQVVYDLSDSEVAKHGMAKGRAFVEIRMGGSNGHRFDDLRVVVAG